MPGGAPKRLLNASLSRCWLSSSSKKSWVSKFVMSIGGLSDVIISQFQPSRSFVSAEWTEALYALYCSSTSFGARQVRDQCPLLPHLWHVSSGRWEGLAGGFWLFLCWGADHLWWFLNFGGGLLKPPCLEELFWPPLLEDLCLPFPLPLPLFKLRLAFASELPKIQLVWSYDFSAILWNFVQRLGDIR